MSLTDQTTNMQKKLIYKKTNIDALNKQTRSKIKSRMLLIEN